MTVATNRSRCFLFVASLRCCMEYILFQAFYSMRCRWYYPSNLQCIIFIFLAMARMFTLLFVVTYSGITSIFTQIITKHCPHTRAQFHKQFSSRVDYRLKIFPELISNIFIFTIFFAYSLGGSWGYGVDINIYYTSDILMYHTQWYVLKMQRNIFFRVVLKSSTCHVADQYKTSPLSSLQNLSNRGFSPLDKLVIVCDISHHPPPVSTRLSVWIKFNPWCLSCILRHVARKKL